MRWFKHMVASGQDEKLILVKDEFGMEGYGVYWSILEYLAAQINKENQQTFIELSPKSWRKVTEFSPKKFQNFAKFCREIDLFYVTFSKEKIRIDCPKLLKYKDEYTRKSGQTPSTQQQAKSGVTPEEETDIDTNIETEIKDHQKKHTEQDLFLAKYIFQKITIIQPKAKKPNFNTWSETIRKMREIDKRTYQEIKDVFDWANNNNFWQTNILSPEKLRSKFDTLQLQSKQGGSNSSNSGGDAFLNATRGAYE